jgi:uncharacterized protein YndB with AHSA1/START domain
VTEPAVTVEDAGSMVSARVRLPGCLPDRALAAFTDPGVLGQWWGGQLSTGLAPGSAYIVGFAQLGSTMTGEVVRYQPASCLEFTWSWAHEPSEIRRTVLVRVHQAKGFPGTELTVEHGPHGDDEAEREARAGHREGWEHFLPRLAALMSRQDEP